MKVHADAARMRWLDAEGHPIGDWIEVRGFHLHSAEEYVRDLEAAFGRMAQIAGEISVIWPECFEALFAEENRYVKKMWADIGRRRRARRRRR